jgi:hypothetical protein
MEDDAPLAEPVWVGDSHRRRAGHLYGLIVCGAVLATAPDEFRLARVAVMMFATLTIYWAAETYVHWFSAHSVAGRDLSRHEGWQIVRDGWPLVAACGLPLLFIALEALLGVETPRALDLALGFNTALLAFVGWQMGRAGGLSGARLALSVGAAGFLGAALITLKTLTH